MAVHQLVQDGRVETYLQSQEEEGTDMLASIQAWGLTATASLQRLVQQALPARPKLHTLDDYEEVSVADVFSFGTPSRWPQCICKGSAQEYWTTLQRLCKGTAQEKSLFAVL